MASTRSVIPIPSTAHELLQSVLSLSCEFTFFLQRVQNSGGRLEPGVPPSNGLGLAKEGPAWKLREACEAWASTRHLDRTPTSCVSHRVSQISVDAPALQLASAPTHTPRKTTGETTKPHPTTPTTGNQPAPQTHTHTHKTYKEFPCSSCKEHQQRLTAWGQPGVREKEVHPCLFIFITGLLESRENKGLQGRQLERYLEPHSGKAPGQPRNNPRLPAKAGKNQKGPLNSKHPMAAPGSLTAASPPAGRWLPAKRHWLSVPNFGGSRCHVPVVQIPNLAEKGPARFV